MQAADDTIQPTADLPLGHQEAAPWLSLRRLVCVHERNTQELAAQLDEPGSNLKLALELVQGPPHVGPISAEYFGRLDQRLHNALSSAVALVDHTRSLVGRYSGTAFAADYTQRNKPIRDADSTHFLRRLRTYVLRSALVPYSFTLRLDSPDGDVEHFAFDVNLDASQLLEWNGWSARARRHIEAAPDGQVQLARALSDYGGRMQELYGWLFDQAPEIWSRDQGERERRVQGAARRDASRDAETVRRD